MGVHQPKDKAVVAAQHPQLEKVYLTLDALYIWTFGTAKISALLFYRRIFCTKAKRDAFHYITIVLLAIVAAWIVVFFVMSFNLCGRHGINWQIQPGNSAKCKLAYPVFRDDIHIRFHSRCSGSIHCSPKGERFFHLCCLFCN